MLARREKRFLELLQQANVLLPDGHGLVWASGAQARLTGSDSVKEILKIATEKKLKVLLIGGNYQANEKGELIIVNGIEKSVIFYTKGYQNISKVDQNEEKEVKLLISEIKPDIVFLAFGAPKQEEWLVSHREFLKNNQVKLAMTVGGSFDFLLNKIKRAPVLWQKLCLEWLWRLIQEPKRLKRQLVLPQFAFLVITGQIK
jgi:N-acetylglucosaminyldiphosphoundecaprenol N-acetyl-beta-D-mannosaminyltransferase